MRRFSGILLALMCACVACDAGRSAEPVRRIVLVTIDTLRADYVGAYGAQTAHTPTLDGIARRGVRFTAAISPAPLTLPSHTSLLTGLEPPHHGVRNNSTFRLSEGVPTLAEGLASRGFATAAFVGAIVLDRQHGLSRGFETYGDRMGLSLAAGDKSFPERSADRVVDEALAWLEAAPDRFFLWLHLYDPHADYDPPPGFAAAFPDNPYAGEIAFADAQIGRLLAVVQERFGATGTLVVATSDHGESLGEHGEVTHSLTLYDATQRVPLLMAGPGLPVGRVVSTPVGLVDVAPTLLALAGAEPLPASDGRDLRALLGADAPVRRPVYVETLAPQIDFGWSPLLGLRSRRFKYIRAPRPELYDLQLDPGELRDLAAQHPERVAELDQILEERLVGGRSPERTIPDPGTQAALEALGYVVSDAGTEPAAGLGQVGGVDPKDMMPQLRELMIALVLMGKDRPAQALERLEPLEAHGFALDLYRSEAALAAGKNLAAERYARAAVDRSPERAGTHVALAAALERRGKLDEAQRGYERALLLDSASSDPLVGLGRLAEARGEQELALRFYDRAAARRGRSAEALWRKAAIWLEQGRDPEPLLSRVPRKLLERPQATLRLARAEVRSGAVQRARARLRRALRSAPGLPELWEAFEALPAPIASPDLGSPVEVDAQSPDTLSEH